MSGRSHHLLLCIFLIAGCSDEPATAADAAAPGPDLRADLSVADAAPDAAADPLVVKTSGGMVRGEVKDGARRYLGIPYAAPPLGKLRFAPPAPHPGWSGVRQAVAFGPGCPQLASKLGAALPAGKPAPFSASEDCLTANVWTPWPLPGMAAPVLVWIHGGGYISGGSSVAHIAPPGTALAVKQGLVVVSFNYRLGPLGFLAHPDLGKGSGNDGVLDQQALLKWVHLNASAFGGDPKNVTIAGESAGAFSVCVHLTSPGSNGLFHRAVMQSGACPQKFPQNSTIKPRAEAEAQAKKLAAAVGCSASVPACLRSKSVNALLKALPLNEDLAGGSTGVTWGPNVDGVTLAKQPLDLVRAGSFHKVPVLLGTNRDEGTLLVKAAGKHMMNLSQYTAAVNKMFGLGATWVFTYYPATSFKSPGAAMAAILGDLVFVCPARRTARALSAKGGKAWLYSFNTAPGFSGDAFLGAYHGAEIPFVFGAPPPGLAFTAAEQKLASAMMGYWARLALAGDPNGGGATTWPGYFVPTDRHLTLDAKIAAGSALRLTRCNFWDSLTP